jgi:hypothetical protein
MHEFVILKGCHHEKGIVHAAGDIARENGVADVPTPHRQSLALAFFEIASSDDGPLSVTGKNSPARFHLVVKIYDAGQPSKPAGKDLLVF